MRTITITFLALVGFLLTGSIIYQNQKTTAFVETIPQPPSPPFETFIAAQGMIESAYKNIPIGASYSDIITHVYVTVGEVLKRGTNLFKTDTRLFEAQLQESLADQALAQEDYENQSLQFSYYENLSDKNAVSKQAYSTAEYNKRLALRRLKKATAVVYTYETHIARSYVQAPIDGEVLQLNIRVGQYAIQTNSNDTSLVLFGDPNYFHVRIDIDEEDSWRYVQGKPAIAYVRGNKTIQIPLEYVYREPYIIPKKSLTGSNIERVDTRVMQVVYRFKKNKLPVFIGELLDVYIQAKPHEELR